MRSLRVDYSTRNRETALFAVAWWVFDMTNSAIARALRFPMQEVTARYANEQGLPFDVAVEHERELKRYLALCASNSDGFYGMRGPIDEFWHTFVVFTRQYADFCNVVAGQFIHHIPGELVDSDSEPPAPREDGANIVDGYKKFLADYETVFGEVPPAHLWPRPMPTETLAYAAAGCVCSCGCRCIA